jgi:hypothetical protein
VGLFNVKIPKSKIFPLAPSNSYPNILVSIQKKSKFGSAFLSPSPEVSKKVSHVLVGQKLREEIDFLEAGCFQSPGLVPWRPAYLRPPTQKLLVQSWTGPKNFIKILSFHKKLFNFS